MAISPRIQRRRPNVKPERFATRSKVMMNDSASTSLSLILQRFTDTIPTSESLTISLDVYYRNRRREYMRDLKGIFNKDYKAEKDASKTERRELAVRKINATVFATNWPSGKEALSQNPVLVNLLQEYEAYKIRYPTNSIKNFTVKRLPELIRSHPDFIEPNPHAVNGDLCYWQGLQVAEYLAFRSAAKEICDTYRLTPATAIVGSAQPVAPHQLDNGPTTEVSPFSVNQSILAVYYVLRRMYAYGEIPDHQPIKVNVAKFIASMAGSQSTLENSLSAIVKDGRFVGLFREDYDAVETLLKGMGVELDREFLDQKEESDPVSKQKRKKKKRSKILSNST